MKPTSIRDQVTALTLAEELAKTYAPKHTYVTRDEWCAACMQVGADATLVAAFLRQYEAQRLAVTDRLNLQVLDEILRNWQEEGKRA